MANERSLRLISSSPELFDEEPDARELAFIARQLVQATLPYREPEGNPPVWYRTNGTFTLTIRPGYETNHATGKIRAVQFCALGRP